MRQSIDHASSNRFDTPLDPVVQPAHAVEPWPAGVPMVDTPAFVRRLHREERGNIWILLMMFYIWVILASIGFTWNTAMVTSRQIHAQTIADSVVYNAAVTKARTMNMVVAGNIANLQHVSADVLLTAVAPFTIHVIYNWVKAILDALKIPIVGPIVAVAVAVKCVQELYVCFPLMKGFFHSVGAIISMIWNAASGSGSEPNAPSFLGGMSNRIAEIYGFQTQVVQVPGQWIPEMVAAYEERYKAEILFGDSVDEESPNEAPNYDISVGDIPLSTWDSLFDFDDIENRFDSIVPMFIRTWRDHSQWYSDLSSVVIGRGPKVWRLWVMVFFVINALAHSHQFYTLPDGIPIFEFTPRAGAEDIGAHFGGLWRPAGFGEFNSSAKSYDDNVDHEAFTDYTMTAAVTFRNIGNLRSRLQWGQNAPASKFRAQFEPRNGGYLFGGMFDGLGMGDSGANWDDSVLAYASAEYFNPTLYRLSAPIDFPFPYRMWSTWGWNWQARLYETHPNFLGARIRNTSGEHIRLPSHHAFDIIGGDNINNMFPQTDNFQNDMRRLMRH